MRKPLLRVAERERRFFARASGVRAVVNVVGLDGTEIIQSYRSRARHIELFWRLCDEFTRSIDEVAGPWAQVRLHH